MKNIEEVKRVLRGYIQNKQAFDKDDPFVKEAFWYLKLKKIDAKNITSVDSLLFVLLQAEKEETTDKKEKDLENARAAKNLEEKVKELEKHKEKQAQEKAKAAEKKGIDWKQFLLQKRQQQVVEIKEEELRESPLLKDQPDQDPKIIDEEFKKNVSRIIAERKLEKTKAVYTEKFVKDLEKTVDLGDNKEKVVELVNKKFDDVIHGRIDRLSRAELVGERKVVKIENVESASFKLPEAKEKLSDVLMQNRSPIEKLLVESDIAKITTKEAYVEVASKYYDLSAVKPIGIQEEIARITGQNVEIAPLLKEYDLTLDKVVQNNWGAVSTIRFDDFRVGFETRILDMNPGVTLSPEQVSAVFRLEDEVVRPLYFLDNGKFLEKFKLEAFNLSLEQGNTILSTKEGYSELVVINKMLQDPKEYKEIMESYLQIKEQLVDLKVPYNFENLKAVEDVITVTQKTPGLKGLIEKASSFVGRSAAFIGGALKYFSADFYILKGMQLLGLNNLASGLVAKVGGQVASQFVANSLAILSQQGLTTGLGTIINGVLSGGVKSIAAGTTAVGTGATAGTAAAGGAAAAGISATGVGAIVVAVVAGMKLIGAWAKKAMKGFSKTTGIDLKTFNFGIKRFLQDNFGKFVGGIINFVLKLGTLLVAIPTVAMGATVASSAMPIIITVIIVVLIFGGPIYVASMVSSVVPPKDYGNNTTIVAPPGPNTPHTGKAEACPYFWPTAHGNIIQGPNTSYSHYGSDEQSIDIQTGRGADVFATHDGILTYHLDYRIYMLTQIRNPLDENSTGIGNGTGNGFYAEVKGNCNHTDFSSRYSHMSIEQFVPNWKSMTVTEIKKELEKISGKQVYKGDKIGKVSNTGSSDIWHLHYRFDYLTMNLYLPKGVTVGCAGGCGVSF